jgi:hypothetical protein
MPVEWAQSLVSGIGAYLGVGIAFAILFLAFGLRRFDPIANAGPLRFKLLIAPGVAALWPVMILLWVRGGAER